MVDKHIIMGLTFLSIGLTSCASIQDMPGLPHSPEKTDAPLRAEKVAPKVDDIEEQIAKYLDTDQPQYTQPKIKADNERGLTPQQNNNSPKTGKKETAIDKQEAKKPSIAVSKADSSKGQQGSAGPDLYEQLMALPNPVKPIGEPARSTSTPTVKDKTSSAEEDGDVQLFIGDNRFVRSDRILKDKKNKKTDEKGVVLSFERASLREVVKVVLGDILKQNYVVEAGVDGEITINSSRPIPRDSLIPTLESLLQTQGAVLFKDNDGAYRIAARTNMRGRGPLPQLRPMPAGYSVRIVPLEYVPALEMQKILEPIASPDNFVRVDPHRNLLVLAGTGQELKNLIATIDTFDVDLLKGMSVGIFRIKNVEADVVAKNLDAVFGESGSSPMAGMFKMLPIEHLNSLMIISSNGEYLKKMKHWVKRFDQASPTAGQQLFVYNVQNGDAEHIADMLGQIFGGGRGGGRRRGGKSNLAPGLKPATVEKGAKQAAEPKSDVKTMLGESSGVTINTDEDVRIVADKENNSLIILSSESMYKQIIEALQRIDVMPMQVLIEASIMEVSLDGELSYGLKWFFKNSLGKYDGQGTLNLPTGLGVGDAGHGSGFNFSVTDPTGVVRGVLDMLAAERKLQVLSSPSILVLDNQQAEIRVGDQIPIVQTTTTEAIVTTSVQYKDTGVSLKVTPRINSGGLVSMEIDQDVTDVGTAITAAGNTSELPFLKRHIKSNVAVHSGETIVLGGLIKGNKRSVKDGIPVLHRLPVVGNLFGGTATSEDRTELVILLTPTVVKNRADSKQIGNEMRQRMGVLMENFEGTAPTLDSFMGSMNRY